jgi:hypothetical protein
MSIQRLIQESINRNPLEMKEALEEELRSRISEALDAKMEKVELDEAASFESVLKAHEYSGSGKNYTGIGGTKVTHYGDHVVSYNEADGRKVHKTPSSLNKHLNLLHDHEISLKSMKEEVELGEAAEKPAHQYYATTQYMNRSEMKMLHDKKKPFATEKEAFEHIKSRGGRQDGTIHKVHTATGKIVSLRHVASGQAGYVSNVGAGDPKHLNELPK